MLLQAELKSYDTDKNLKYLLFGSLHNKFDNFWSETSHYTIGGIYDNV